MKLLTLKSYLLAALLLGHLSGCGVTNKVAVGTLIPMMQSTLDATYRDRDVETVREGLAANLMLLRGVAEDNPGTEEFRIMAAQAYFSFALGFVEDYEPDRALLLYGEGWRLGREYLETQDWFRDAEAQKPTPSQAALDRIDYDDVPLLFWTLANWARWISTNLGDPAAVAQLPRVEMYLQRIIELRPDYFMGLPLAMQGSLQSFRPEMLGGKPEESRQNFEEALRISGNRMLYFHVLYAEYYCRRMFDEDCFVERLTRVLEASDTLLPEYQLWNEVAKDKAAFLLEMQDELF